MKLRARHLWFLLPLVPLGVLALVYWAVDEFTREPPNYTRVEPGLYVGGSVERPPWRARAVLNVCEVEDPYRAEVHEWHPIRDAAPAPNLNWLKERVRFVEEQRAAGRTVYVHCFAGVSRSGMVAAAYLMKRDGLTPAAALARLRESRPNIRPNAAFLALLDEWEREMTGK